MAMFQDPNTLSEGEYVMVFLKGLQVWQQDVPTDVEEHIFELTKLASTKLETFSEAC